MSPVGILGPTSTSTPTANAMSVAIGIAQPSRASAPLTSAKKMRTGATIPPSAAAAGTTMRRTLASSPSTISRLISIPTTKKKTTIAASLIQKWSGSSTA